jgi:hypothetical protein
MTLRSWRRSRGSARRHIDDQGLVNGLAARIVRVYCSTEGLIGIEDALSRLTPRDDAYGDVRGIIMLA